VGVSTAVAEYQYMHSPLPTRLPAAKSSQSPNLLNPPNSKKFRRWKERKTKKLLGEIGAYESLKKLNRENLNRGAET
jgi:hypothetical protein